MYSNTKMERIWTDKDLTRVWLLFEYIGVSETLSGRRSSCQKMSSNSLAITNDDWLQSFPFWRNPLTVGPRVKQACTHHWLRQRYMLSTPLLSLPLSRGSFASIMRHKAFAHFGLQEMQTQRYVFIRKPTKGRLFLGRQIYRRDWFYNPVYSAMWGECWENRPFKWRSPLAASTPIRQADGEKARDKNLYQSPAAFRSWVS